MYFQRTSGKTRKPEAVFQSQIIKYLKACYGPRLWYCNVAGGIGMRSGIPDLLICLDGEFIALEIKNPNGRGRLGPKQADEIEALRQAGASVAIVASWEELESVLAGFPKSQLTIRDRAKRDENANK